MLPVLLAQVVVIVDLVGVLPPVFLLFRLPSQALDFSLERVHLKVQLSCSTEQEGEEGGQRRATRRTGSARGAARAWAAGGGAAGAARA